MLTRREYIHQLEEGLNLLFREVGDMDVVTERQQKRHQQAGLFALAQQISDVLAWLLSRGSLLSAECWITRKTTSIDERDFLLIVSDPYWTRVWTQQEFFLAGGRTTGRCVGSKRRICRCVSLRDM
jgi:hypothetical protein